MRIIAYLAVALHAGSWSGFAAAGDMPIGIPNPSFGLVESRAMYDGSPDHRAGPNGPYTHWVNNLDSGCQDAGPGTQETPLCSIPTSLAAGDVVEIHGGPYEARDDWRIQATGRSDKPIFIVGIDDGNGFPILSSASANEKVFIDGSYTVLENLTLLGTGIRLGLISASDHLAVRGIDLGWHGSTCVTVHSNHSVISDSEIHHCQSATRDLHGIVITEATNYVWVLNNDIHHNSANAIQYAHNASAAPPDFVFIGGNHLHHDREVGVATKWAGRTVVSSNTIHGYRPSYIDVEWCFEDGSGCMMPQGATNGPGIIIGADGGPVEKWVIYNLIYDSNHCIRNEKGGKIRIIGNICADIESAGIGLEKAAEDLYIAHNTFYQVGKSGSKSIILQDWRDQFSPKIHNNLILSPRSRVMWIESRLVMSGMVFRNNLIWNGGADFEFLWNNDVVQIGSLAELRSVMLNDVLEMADNQVVDPGIVVANSPMPTVDIFAPPADSAAVGAANDVLLTLDAEFKATFGPTVSIIPDHWRDGVFDIGAVPNGYSDAIVRPLPPTIEFIE